jgi:hypothetical protein
MRVLLAETVKDRLLGLVVGVVVLAV